MVANPTSVFLSMRKHFPGECFILESVEGTVKTARYSFIGACPISTFKSKSNRIWIDDECFYVKDPYEAMKKWFYSFDCGLSQLAPYSGGAVGYFSYEFARHFENIKGFKQGNEYDAPEAYFLIPTHLVCIDHLHNRTFFISYGSLHELHECAKAAETCSLAPVRLGTVVSEPNQQIYEEIVHKAKEYIVQGDIFQVVISRRIEFDFEGDSLSMYLALRKINPSPYLFLIDFKGIKLIGSSPEMLVRMEGKKLTTRPIAGTRRRDPDREEDEKLKIEMLLDEKERSEHIMLVDLARNDLGKVSKPGTVKATELLEIEKYSHVQHIVSNIESELRDDCDAFDVLKSCFPAGTVTGAPKIRAMEIISELERVPRGPYAGAVGYFDFNGCMDFAITIRSIVVSDGKARIQAGAGIVADSIPTLEYHETEQKMKAMITAISSISQRERA
ncbi:MAG: anthranilate synthase component I family protein [Methanomassiliicoccales archaeon]